MHTILSRGLYTYNPTYNPILKPIACSQGPFLIQLHVLFCMFSIQERDIIKRGLQYKL